MAYNLRKRKERNMAEESENGDEDNDDGKIILDNSIFWIKSYFKSTT